MNPDPDTFPLVLPPLNEGEQTVLRPTPGWATPMVSEFTQSVERIEDFMLGSFGIFIQQGGYFRIRTYSRTNDRWSVSSTPISGCTVAVVQVFHTLEYAHLAARNQTTIRKREGYYHRKSRSMKLQLQPKILEQAAASATLSTPQLAISAGTWGNARFAGDVSLRFTDGNILKGSERVSHQIPALHYLFEAKIDDIYLIICLEPEWAIHRLVGEGFLQRLRQAGFPTLLVSTGGIAADNTKSFLKFVTTTLAANAKVVFIGDHDVAAVQIAATLKYGGTSIAPHKTQICNLQLAFMSNQQVQSRASLCQVTTSAQIERGKKLLDKIKETDGSMGQALRTLISDKKCLQLSELVHSSISFSDEIYAMIHAALSRPLEQADENERGVCEPMFNAQEMQAYELLPLSTRKQRNDLCFITISDDLKIALPAGKYYFILNKPPEGVEIPFQAVLEEYPPDDSIQRLQTVYESMTQVLSTSRRENIKQSWQKIEQVITSIVDALHGLPLQRPHTLPNCKVAEALILRDILYRINSMPGVPN